MDLDTVDRPAPQRYEYQDFDDCTVFKYLFGISDPFEQAMAETRLAKRAQEVGFKNFKRLWGIYRQKASKAAVTVIEPENGTTDFGDQELELDTGTWRADETGIWRYGPGGIPQIACTHPIMPVKRKRSIDTGSIKYTLAWRRGTNRKRPWDYVDIDASDMLSPTEIVKKLSPRGISVSGGDRAKLLVDYLRDITDSNYEIIPEVKSVSRLGWNEDGFSPYTEDVEFDGFSAFAPAFAAFTPHGSMDKWMEEALDARTYSLTARIVLASSFAAPLVEKLGTLSFFVHLWSVSSGTGKTVGQMLGASVWADPAPGGAFFPTFRSTSVGMEIMAGFLHSIPMFIDELQLAKDHHGNVRFNVYELASGSGKLRSNKQLGMNYTPTWATCFVTSGETPLTKETDGEGALNRVLEIECTADHKVINDGLRTANVLRENYGWAGRIFMHNIQQDGAIDKAKELYERYFAECVQNDTTEKQAMAAATILTADALATEWIFHDGRQLTVEEVASFAKQKERVSLMERGYDILCDWVAINANRLRGLREEDKGECYGIADDKVACIIRSVFNRVCAENAIDEKGILSHLKSRGLIETRPNKKTYTKTKRLGKNFVAECICLKLPQNEVDESDADQVQMTELPDNAKDYLPF